MRIDDDIRRYFKKQVDNLPVKAEIYLFGSRVKDEKKGGDLDLVILSEKPLERGQLQQLRIDFFKRFGMQKLDLLNYTFDESDPFKSVIMTESEPL